MVNGKSPTIMQWGKKMFETCQMCGYIGPVANTRLHNQPILAFYCAGGRHRYPIDVWLCDVCGSKVRNQGDAKLNSLKPTDQTESEKGDKDV